MKIELMHLESRWVK